MNGDDPRHNARMRREPPPRREPPARPRPPQPHPGEARWGAPQPPPRQARGPQPERRQPPPGQRVPPRNPNARNPQAAPPRRGQGQPAAPVPPRATRKYTAEDLDPAPTHAPRQRPVPYREGTPPPPSLPPTKRGRGGDKPPKGPRPKRKRHWKRWLSLILIVLVALPLAALFYVETNLVRIDAFGADRVADTPGTNWLLVGSDSRAGLTPEQEQELATGGEVGSERTDTIILIHIPKSGAPTLVSLPRDSYVSIPGYGKDKLNASFSLGGPQLLTQTVETATGLRIDHYAQIGFSGFADIVDAVGGIDMCLDQPIDDPLAGIDLAAGCQRLNGAESLGFVRSRATALADLDRMNNQRKFMAALLKKATSPATLLNPLRGWPLLQGLTKALKVDQGAHVWDLARLGWALKGDPIATTVPIGGFEDTDSGNVLMWDKTKASQFFEALAADKPIPSELLTTVD
ncbi:LCP family protein [Nocardia sp. NPDC050406]|uniref:LCP family protein n=1 Tax=Nocardia sp. NPDC050406 TaxID=3364318 RepID=UPI0037B14286